MNITALLIAIVGAGIVVTGFFVASKVDKKSTSTIIKIVSGAGGFFSMAVFVGRHHNAAIFRHVAASIFVRLTHLCAESPA